jgi:hypothetical protein
MLGRSRTFPKEGMLPNLEIRPCDPVFIVFFTTGEISIDGWPLCRKAGIAAMDGEMFASFLADKEVSSSIKDGESRLDRGAFAEWLGTPGELSTDEWRFLEKQYQTCSELSSSTGKSFCFNYPAGSNASLTVPPKTG